ncbi:MAG: hypothetical protein GY861_24615, partial [bacterium]|nr:hypothetical protein [bacterium]
MPKTPSSDSSTPPHIPDVPRLELLVEMLEIQRDQQTLSGTKHRISALQLELVMLQEKVPEMTNKLEERVNTWNEKLKNVK